MDDDSNIRSTRQILAPDTPRGDQGQIFRGGYINEPSTPQSGQNTVVPESPQNQLGSASVSNSPDMSLNQDSPLRVLDFESPQSNGNDGSPALYQREDNSPAQNRGDYGSPEADGEYDLVDNSPVQNNGDGIEWGPEMASNNRYGEEGDSEKSTAALYDKVYRRRRDGNLFYNEDGDWKPVLNPGF
tara:strand:+ start:285 stop:842 length:558 start_codon:yes stop_codon:yes gene_type:complete